MTVRLHIISAFGHKIRYVIILYVAAVKINYTMSARRYRKDGLFFNEPRMISIVPRTMTPTVQCNIILLLFNYYNRHFDL